MWTVAANNKKFPDALGTYNSLYDPHLHQYFRKPKVRSHLIHAGLMTSEGKIIPEALVRLRKLEEQRRQQLHSLLTEVLENGKTNRVALQQLHDTHDLESQAKQELVRRAKIAFGSSTGGTTAQTSRTHSYPSSSERRTQSTNSSVSWLRRMVQIRPKFFNTRKKRVRVNNSHMRYQRPKSSYGIRSSNKVKPDFKLDDELCQHFADILSLDGESIHDSDDSDSEHNKRSGLWHKKTKTSAITLCFNGLTSNSQDPRRIQISQQLYAGGNAIIIFDKMVVPGEQFTFNVRPHGSKPFCITVLIDGIRDLRVSTCCEHKHKKGSKISHFTLMEVTGNKKCANCKKGISSANRITPLPKTESSNIKESDIEINVEDNVDNISDDGKGDNSKDDSKDKKVVDHESDVEEVEEQTVIERNSSRASSTADPNYNDEQFENYDSEFEAESQESLKFETNSFSSDDNSVDANGRQEVVKAEIHKAPD